jgi:hypothetical protein
LLGEHLGHPPTAAIRANGGTLVAMERIAAADVEAVLAADES